jgi:predicted RNA polymerase sigma factor
MLHRLAPDDTEVAGLLALMRWFTVPAAGLKRLDELAEDPRLEGHHRLDAVRAHLLERAGDREGAIVHYQRAAERTTSLSERNYLLTHAARLSETPK